MNLKQLSDRNWRQSAAHWFDANRNAVEPPSLSFVCLAGVLGIQVEPECQATGGFKHATAERLPFLRKAIFGDLSRWRPETSPIDNHSDQSDERDSDVKLIASGDSSPDPRPDVIEHWIAKGICACRANEQASAARWLRRLIANRATDHMGTRSIARFLYCSQAADGSFGMNESVFHSLARDLGPSAPEYILILKAELTFQTAWALDCFEREQAVAIDNAVAARGGGI